MQAAKRVWLDEAAYLELERAAEVRSEYFEGEMFAMAGGSEAHSLLAASCIRLLGNALESRPCRVYTSDMRVKVEATGLHTYPDISVVCGPPRMVDEHRDTLLNPVLIVEVLSPATQGYDRSIKFDHYRQIPSVQEYVLVWQDEARIERYQRGPDQTWTLRAVYGLEGRMLLTSVGVELSLGELYRKVELPEKPARVPGMPAGPPLPMSQAERS